MGFIVSIWCNGNKKNPKFEFRVSPKDRDRLFSEQEHGNSINLLLPKQNEPHAVNIRPSFWNKCSHFGSDNISEWLDSNNHVPYEKDHPPKFRMKKLDEGKFEILGLVGK